MQTAERFATLDALRGIAALCVVCFHAGVSAPVAMPGGYLAVDLFFGLSGFVLASSYETRLRNGMAWREFMRRRVLRLWPMCLVGALLGVLLHGGNPNMLLLVPDVRSPGNLYPANPPLWSLLAELVVGAGYALVAPRLGGRALLATLAVSGAVLCVSILDLGRAVDIGAFWFSAPAGLARAVFSFTLGVAMCRFRGRLPAPRSTHLAWLVLAMVPLVLALDPASRAAWDIACIALFLPALLWLGTSWELPARRLAERLGDLSYPLYCIHVPIIAALPGGRLETSAVCLLLIGCALALDRWVDRPARSWLNRRFVAAPAVPA